MCNIYRTPQFLISIKCEIAKLYRNGEPIPVTIRALVQFVYSRLGSEQQESYRTAFLDVVRVSMMQSMDLRVSDKPFTDEFLKMFKLTTEKFWNDEKPLGRCPEFMFIAMKEIAASS